MDCYLRFVCWMARLRLGSVEKWFCRSGFVWSWIFEARATENKIAKVSIFFILCFIEIEIINFPFKLRLKFNNLNRELMNLAINCDKSVYSDSKKGQVFKFLTYLIKTEHSSNIETSDFNWICIDCVDVIVENSRYRKLFDHSLKFDYLYSLYLLYGLRFTICAKTLEMSMQFY